MVSWSISDDLVRGFDSTQIALCYRSVDPNTGTRNNSHMDAVKDNRGGFQIIEYHTYTHVISNPYWDFQLFNNGCALSSQLRIMLRIWRILVWKNSSVGNVFLEVIYFNSHIGRASTGNCWCSLGAGSTSAFEEVWKKNGAINISMNKLSDFMLLPSKFKPTTSIVYIRVRHSSIRF
ncbi:uncharacterized protein LOC111389643 [Olea europaea var. sylvestris]|uniref:uncharacterized protein LOC111389643 n=1 Tax=Olea europaea var. sylvestris TaxID=158386 RepID=UPI000C1CD551|nr:uncharacterized protein LOC111389643 [Olea europaea var. sylvestris]